PGCRIDWRILSTGLLLLGLVVNWPVAGFAQSKKAGGEKSEPKNAEPENAEPENAEPKNAEPKNAYGTFTFQLENDLFYGADRHYTNGLRLSWVSPSPADTRQELNLIRERLQLIGLNNNKDTRLGLALAQEMYTPADRHRSDLIPGDRPYAGWLYGAVSLHSKTVFERKPHGFEAMLNSVELDLGIVGQHAYAKETQDYIHDIRLFERFDGWHNQLRDEPGILLMYERKFRTGSHDAFPADLQMDAVPYVGGSIGNVLTHVNAGGAVRYGYNIPKDFGPPNLIKDMRTLDAGPLKNDGWSLYGFAGAEGRFVARNIFLDGNTWRDSHRVDKEPWVADLSLGLAYEWGRFKIAYTEVLRTREFKGQDDNAHFGSFSLSWRLLY
ncbi:MAG: lipid A deacylase LpxR family protein, partial [Alphaproteobacteria bacterium]|nr:lipid A deacylase LpxR family protein [Alphaproteobacteria bacterium]